jgi:tetratricopeptide (TPR) repeat protein
VGAGLLATQQGDNEVALGLFEEGLACARAAGSTLIEAHALSLLSFFTRFGRDEQVRLGEEAIAKARASGDRRLLGLVTGNLSSVMSRLGETETATALTEEAYRLLQGGGDVFGLGIAASGLAAVALEEGDFAAARARLNEALELARLIEDTRGIGFVQDGFGWLELFEGKPRPRGFLLRGGGGDRTEARRSAPRCRGDLGPGPGGRRRRRRRSGGAPCGGRGRVRTPGRIRPDRIVPMRLCGHRSRGSRRARVAGGVG